MASKRHDIASKARAGFLPMSLTKDSERESVVALSRPRSVELWSAFDSDALPYPFASASARCPQNDAV